MSKSKKRKPFVEKPNKINLDNLFDILTGKDSFLDPREESKLTNTVDLPQWFNLDDYNVASMLFDNNRISYIINITQT